MVERHVGSALVVAGTLEADAVIGSVRENYDQWVRNLESAEIDWLAIFRLHAQERYIAADREGFPIERTWAMDHPERFEGIVSGRAFELYRLQGTRSRPSRGALSQP